MIKEKVVCKLCDKRHDYTKNWCLHCLHNVDWTEIFERNERTLNTCPV